MKTRITLLIALLLCATTNLAMAEITSGEYTYTVLPDGTAEITKYGIDEEWDIEAMIEGRPIERNVIDQLQIPVTLDGHPVSSIAAHAFYGIDDIIHVTVPEGVRSIGDGAFLECDDMVSIMLPNSLTSMGANPFEGCYTLTSIEIDSDHPYLIMHDGVLFSKPDKRLICFPYSKQNIENITDPNDMFCGGKCIDAEFDIPKGTEIIGDAAFAGCEGLWRISIPNTVSRIGSRAFSGCSLDEVVIPESVVSIGDLVFERNIGLEKASLPSSLITVGDNPFAACEELKKIKVASGNSELGIKDGVLFSKSDMRLISYPGAKEVKKYEIPSGVREVGAYAFSQSAITEITIPDTVTKIGDCAISDVYDLQKVVVPASVTEIGADAFGRLLDWNDELVVETVKGSYAESYWQNYVSGHEDDYDDRDDYMID